MMAGIGVTRLELCSPIGYGPEFASLANGKEVRTILADHGMKAESSHFSHEGTRNSQQQSIEWAKEVGITQMVTATLGDGNGGSHPDARPGEARGGGVQRDRRRGREGRDAAGPAQRGVRARDGRWPPRLRPVARIARSETGQVPVPDVEITAGFVGAEYFLKYPGRFNSMHLQDIDMNAPLPPPSAEGRPRAAPAGGGGEGQHRLGEDVSGGEGGRRPELLRRADLGTHRAERGVSQDARRVTSGGAGPGGPARIPGAIQTSRTTLPMLPPPCRWRIAAGASANGNRRPMCGGRVM